MRSLFLVLVAAFLVASNAQGQLSRRRLGEAEHKKSPRGVNAKYTGLASEVDFDVKNQVQRRHLKEKEIEVNVDDGEDDSLEPIPVEDDSSSMSMSLSMSMSM